MKKLLLLFLTGMAFFSCDDDPARPEATAHLNFRAVYDGSPLVMYQDYTYPDNRLIRFQNFNFFISNVVLLPSEGSDEVKLTDIEFVEFSENTAINEAQTPVTFSKKNIPAGNYKGIRIGIGVPSNLNNANAGQFSAGHPLKKTFTTHFWSDWKSFIFMKCEGIYDLDGNGIFSATDRGFEHHPGMDAVYQNLTLLKPIVIEEGKPFDLNLVVDVLKIYEMGGNYLDLADPINKDTQEASDLPLALSLMQNFAQALTLE